MLEKCNAVRLLNCLTALFIKIRANPEAPTNLEILSVFVSVFSKDIKYSRPTIKLIIDALENLGEFEFKTYIISKLKRFYVKGKRVDINRIKISREVFLDIMKCLYSKLQNKEFEKAGIMASAVHNYPSLLLKSYNCDPAKFWDEHICYYRRVCNEDFLIKWEPLFKSFY